MLRSILAAAVLFAAQSAIAQESNAENFTPDWYVGAGVGQGRMEASFDGFEFDGDDTAWQLMMGYQASPHVGLEFGYLAGGEVSDLVAGVPVTVESSAFMARIMGTLPFPGGFSLHGSIGISRWDADGNVGGFQVDDNGTDPTFGAGAGFRYQQTLFRLNYERADIEDFDVELFTFSVLFMI